MFTVKYVKPLLLISVLVFACSGCGRGIRADLIAESKVEPLILMPDGAVLAFVPKMGDATDIYRVQGKSSSKVAALRNVGIFVGPVSAECFASGLGAKTGNRFRFSIYLQDIKQQKTSLLIDNASMLGRSSAMLSSDRKALLAEKYDEGLVSVSVPDGAVRVLLKGRHVSDATWIRDSRDVLCACYEQLTCSGPGPRVVKVYRITSNGISEEWSKPINEVNGIACSPDGDKIIYISNGSLICESLRSRGKWTIPTGKLTVAKESGMLSDIIKWARDGAGCFILLEGKERQIFIVNTKSKEVDIQELPASARLVNPLGWLSDNQSFIMSLVKEGEDKFQILRFRLPSR